MIKTIAFLWAIGITKLLEQIEVIHLTNASELVRIHILVLELNLLHTDIIPRRKTLCYLFASESFDSVDDVRHVEESLQIIESRVSTVEQSGSLNLRSFIDLSVERDTEIRKDIERHEERLRTLEHGIAQNNVAHEQIIAEIKALAVLVKNLE